MFAVLQNLMRRQTELYKALPPVKTCPECGSRHQDTDDPRYRAWSDNERAIDNEIRNLASDPDADPREVAIVANRPYSGVELAMRHERERLARQAAAVAHQRNLDRAGVD